MIQSFAVLRVNRRSVRSANFAFALAMLGMLSEAWNNNKHLVADETATLEPA
jgi:hypothetical protein